MRFHILGCEYFRFRHINYSTTLRRGLAESPLVIYFAGCATCVHLFQYLNIFRSALFFFGGNWLGVSVGSFFAVVNKVRRLTTPPPHLPHYRH